MTHASLFSGIGGPEVAAEMLGWTNLFHCEINPFGRAVLAYHFPESVSYEDITKTDFTQWRGRVDVLTGGFPCQPFSYAGKRGGADDDRYLWPQMCRAIQECQPTWVVGENVAGLATMVEQCEITELGAQPTLFEAVEAVPESLYEERGRYTIDRICQDLEAIGYAVQPVLIPACGVGAPHRRDRIFIVGYAQNAMRSGQLVGHDGEQGSERNERNAGAGDSERLRGETSRTASADTAGNGRGEGDSHMESDLAERNEPVSESSKRNATHTADAGTEGVRREWQDAVHRPGHATDTDRKADTRNGDAADTIRDRLARLLQRKKYVDAQWQGQIAQDITDHIRSVSPDRGRWESFPTVSPVHRGNDGLPFNVDDLTIPFAQWRTESLKAYGNAIVPQVMYEIFRAIEEIERN